MKIIRRFFRFILRRFFGWTPTPASVANRPRGGKVYKDRWLWTLKQKPAKKIKVQLYEVVGRTAGGAHYFVESNVGRIRKPANSLHPKMVAKFLERTA